MPEPQLSVRGADVVEMAHDLAKQDGRTVRAVVTEALRDLIAKRQREAARAQEDYWAEFDAIAARIRETVDPGALAAASRDDLYDEDGLPG